MLARVRDTAGRVATVAGSAVLTAGLATDTVTLPGVLAAAATAGIGLATNWKILRAPEAVRGTAIALYAIPHAGATAVLIGEMAAPDTLVSVLVQAGAVVLWTGAVWRLRPGTLARQVVTAGEDQELTALGKEMRGEGLVGLTGGLMYAGAARVVVSLWSVSDRATAELMRRFYHGMLEQGLTPPAALREAQLSMAQEPQWRAPYFWAGFVLLGEREGTIR